MEIENGLLIKIDWLESNYSLKNATDLKYQYGRDCLEIAKTCWLKSQPRSGSNRQSDEF